MELSIELKTGKASYSQTVDNVDDWSFVKNVVDQLLKINPDEKVLIHVDLAKEGKDFNVVNGKKLKPKRKYTKRLQPAAKPKKKPQHKYPPELDPFIRERINKMTNPELIEKINKNFPFYMSYTQFASFKKDHGIKRTEKVKIARQKRGSLKYPKEMEDFLEANVEEMTNKELIEEVNRRFDVGITETRLTTFMTRKGIKRNRSHL